ncbi:aminoacetone oxidase family FAD-binding enzyme, partial [Myxococcota bacterium]|nr:aminoacetone oxidase family FAD-binding enzyme [Myxococcota bacterium]
MPKTIDIAIIGAGASGLASAIFLAEALRESKLRAAAPSICILEGTHAVGTKILASGGGRCNLSNKSVKSRNYEGDQKAIAKVLKRFGTGPARRFFEGLGIEIQTEPSGKIFPKSNDARRVRDALVDKAESLGVQILKGQKILKIEALGEQDSASEPAFILNTETESFLAHKVIMATGGRSLPKSGSDGSAYALLRSLGHSLVQPHMALVPLNLDPKFFHEKVSGISHEVQLSAWKEGRKVGETQGQLLWTHFGISGPAVLDISRHLTGEQAHGTTLQVNLLGGESYEQIQDWIISESQKSPNRRLQNLLESRLAKRLVSEWSSYMGLNLETKLTELKKEKRKELIHALVNFPLPVVGNKGWHHAEVTAGGVSLKEIELKT